MSDQTHLSTASAQTSEVAEIFVSLADTLVDDYDVVELLDRLVGASTRLLGFTATGILLDDQRGNLAVVASSSEESRLLEVYQLQSAQGPCLDCVRTAVRVSSPDLSQEMQRWPLFVPAAQAAGFQSVTAVPLRLRNATIGAMNLFQDQVRQTTPDELRLAQALADIATIGILHQRSVHRSSILAEQLQHALNSRVIIEQAKGVLAERGSCSMEAAFDALRRYARDRNLKLADAADAVIRSED